MLTSCAAGYVRTSSTAFLGADHLQRGALQVLPIDKSQEGSLEFQAVSNHLSKKLLEHGYLPTRPNEQPEFVAYITYGIDNGKTSMTSVPIYGQTGGGTSFSSGTVTSGTSIGSYNGTTTTMPTYGVVGVMPVSEITYKRAVNIDIYKFSNSATKKVYEIRAVSTGSCGNINSILFNIIDGIFKNFPNENGKSQTVDIEWNGVC